MVHNFVKKKKINFGSGKGCIRRLEVDSGALFPGAVPPVLFCLCFNFETREDLPRA